MDLSTDLQDEKVAPIVFMNRLLGMVVLEQYLSPDFESCRFLDNYSLFKASPQRRWLHIAAERSAESFLLATGRCHEH